MFTPEIQVYDLTTHNFDVGHYPDGTPLLERPPYAAETAKQLILRPKSLESFVTGLFLADAYAERGHRIPDLVLPFIPGARQDRLNPGGDYLFTAKSVAKMINERNFDRVLVLDPHSHVSAALIDRCEVYPVAGVFQHFRHDFDGVIAPDAGAGHRAQEVAKFLGWLRFYSQRSLPVVQASKTRDVATGKLSGFEVNVEEGSHYLVLDDICDGGGTFVGLGQKIEEQGATAALFVSHGIFSKGVEELNKYYTHITTTDSTLFDKYDTEVLEITERMKTWLTH